MKSTRQRLLDMLKNKPDSTAAELSRALQLTQADIRHHLSNMLAEGLIVKSGHQHDGRRGRPARKFRIANVNKDKFDLLLGSLLVIYQQGQAPHGEKAFFKRLAVQLVGEDIAGNCHIFLARIYNASVTVFQMKTLDMDIICRCNDQSTILPRG